MLACWFERLYEFPAEPGFQLGQVVEFHAFLSAEIGQSYHAGRESADSFANAVGRYVGDVAVVRAGQVAPLFFQLCLYVVAVKSYE